MKRILAALLIIVMLFLCACQPSPETEIVIGKGDALENTINAAPVPIVESTVAYSAPKTLSDEYCRDKTQIIVNAQINVVPVAAYPVLRIKNLELNNELAEKFVTALVGDKQLIDGNVPYTKDELSKKMLESILHFKQGDWDFDQSIQSEDDLRDIYESEIEHAPEKVEKSVIDRSLLAEGFTARVESENVYDEWIQLKNYDDLGMVATYWNNGDTAIEMLPQNHEPKIIQMTREEAQAKAEEVVSAIGLKNMAVSYYEPYTAPINRGREDYIGNEKFSAHRFVFTRTVNGTPLTYTEIHQANTNEQYAATWYNEEFEVHVDDRGIVFLRWQGGIETIDTVNHNVALLPLEQITEKAFNNLFLSNVYQQTMPVDGCIRFTIDNIRLGYMRIREKDNNLSSLLIPVWDFFGGVQFGVNEDSDIHWGEMHVYDNTPMLTLNAIDGSNIDRKAGW